MKNSKGFTLLISVLIVSVMLGITVGISSIIRGEIILANTGRQSQLAYYAADAGAECAIYWDTVHDEDDYESDDPSPFATSTPNTSNTIDCGDDDLNPSYGVGEWPLCTNGLTGTETITPCTSAGQKRAGRSNFVIRFGNGSCAKVQVIKRENYSDPNFPVIETFIRSDGQSEGDANCNSTSPRVFQRSIETTTYE